MSFRSDKNWTDYEKAQEAIEQREVERELGRRSWTRAEFCRDRNCPKAGHVHFQIEKECVFNG